MTTTKLPPKLMTRSEVLDVLGVSRGTLYNLLQEGGKYSDPDFPKPIRISQTRLGWISDEICRYIEIKASKRRENKAGEKH